MTRILKPLRDYNSYSDPLMKAIFDYFEQLIYAPLKAIVLNKEKENATVTPLEDALRRGVMEYRDGYFVGAYKASITRELRGIGAIYSHQRKVYYIEISRLPQNILQAISAGKQSSQNIIDKVNKILREKELEGPKPMDLTPFFGATIAKLGKQFFTTTKPVTSADLEIPINPKFADEMEETYTKNLNLYIQGWHQEAIERMRVKMSEAFSEGRRAENLLGIIQSERGVSYRKAKFLARQENSLLTASYTEIRLKDIGINEYIWQTSMDCRVRPDHKLLHGHLFRFDHPPIIDRKRGRRGNPGEDYGPCRCKAAPFIRGGINMITPSMGGQDAAIKRNIEEYATR